MKLKRIRSKQSGFPPAYRLLAGSIKKNLILITYYLILSLILCQTYSYAAMTKMRNPAKTPTVQTVFLKKV